VRIVPTSRALRDEGPFETRRMAALLRMTFFFCLGGRLAAG
jgi:hypothetical protein